MYKLRNLLDKAPNIIAASIFATANFIASCVFVAMDVKPSVEFAGLLMNGETALVLVLNLFVVQPNTVTNRDAAAQVDQAKTDTKAEIVEFLATEPPPTPKKAVAAAKKAK